jgi:hypothetical protein
VPGRREGLSGEVLGRVGVAAAAAVKAVDGLRVAFVELAKGAGVVARAGDELGVGG